MGDPGNLITGGSEGRGPLQLALTLGTWALLLSILVFWGAAVLAALGYLGPQEQGVRTELEEAGTDWTSGIYDFLLDTLAPKPGLEDAEEKSKKPKRERKEEDVIKEIQHKAGKKKRKEEKMTKPAYGKKMKKEAKGTEKDVGVTKPKKVKESSEKRGNGREKTSGKGHAEDCHQTEKKTDTKKKKDNRKEETKKRKRKTSD
uniref:putative uncharacterized protein DDB_G0292636 n=1 Tax=Myxine glutinosa TaxID=7769 RepID=UPI00358F40BD